MHPGILYTKTVVPPADDAVVERLVRFSDILQDLQRSDAFSRRLTLVQAPAGFGKTTAVRNWITHSGKPAAWYAMDEQDHHPLTFWSYVMAAIGVIQPETVREPQAILMNPETDDPGDDSWTSWMVPFLNALMHAEDPFLIVIDDFHFASSPEITSAMAYLIEHLPSTVHVLITTRERPPWPIVKWQAKGWLTDVGKDRLRFSIPEADMLFEKRGVRVNPSLTEELVNWSEGWITGLELTLVSHLYGTMQPGHDALGHSDLGVKTLTAFLTEEVLRQLPGHLLDFMETSAVLHKFSPVMCDEVLERSDSQEVIRFLEEKQLFLVRLNDDGSWFRYHHIMGETLTDRLRQSDPAVIRRIHQRASDWLSRNGALHEAIHHADKAEDEGRVAQILHYHAESLTYSREPVAFIERINALSHERLRSFPELFAYSLFYRLLMKGHDGCDALINEARTLSCDNRQNQLVYEGMLDVLSFFYWTGHHAFDKARVYADSALEKLPQENYFWRMSAAVFSGDLLYYAGAPEEALPYFEEAHAMNLKHERHYFAISTELKKAVTFFELGRLSDARKTVASIEQLAEAHGFSGISKMGFVHTLEGELTREQGNLEEAARLHDKARSRLPDEHGLLAWHHLFEAKLRYSDGRVTDALQIINRILKPEQVNQIPRYMLLQASKRKLIYLMKLNRYDEAYALLDETGIRQGEGFPESPDLHVTALLAWSLRAGTDIGEISEEILQVMRTAVSYGRSALAVEVFLLLMWLYQRKNMPEMADDLMREMIPICRSCGYRQTIVDEGDIVQESLIRLRNRQTFLPDDSLYAGQLLDTLQPQAATSEAPLLPEPLSSRELDVLRLIMKGLTNKLIADSLYLSTGTVKWHTTNIYGKLGVSRRTEAVAKARSHGILTE